MKNITNGMKESRIPDLLTSVLCSTLFLESISFKLVLLMLCFLCNSLVHCNIGEWILRSFVLLR